MAGVAVKTWREIWIRPEVRSTPLERYRPCDHARASPIPAGTLIIAQGGWSHASHPLGWLLRWLVLRLHSAQVYPIVAAIGGAVSLCTFFCARQISSSPGFRVWKEGRAHEGIPEEKFRVKEGVNWREHFVRRAMRDTKPAIFPGLNDAMTSPKWGPQFSARSRDVNLYKLTGRGNPIWL